MIPVTSSVSVIPGVGEVIRGHLAQLGIATVADLLRWYPRDYLDASIITPINQLPYGRLAAIRVSIEKIHARRSKTRNIPMLEARCRDEAGTELLVRWFNQSFLQQKLKEGSEWIFIGVANRFQGEAVMMSPIIEDSPAVLSIYGQTKGVTSRMLRGYVKWALDHTNIQELGLPAEIEASEGLVSAPELMKSLHQPKTMAGMDALKKQLAFEEVFWFFTRMALTRAQHKKSSGVKISVDVEWLKNVVERLPFSLTAGQKRAVWDAVQDLGSGQSMTRLLNGDVGSGKTAVAGLISAVVAQNGLQSVILVPTEILAKQHSQSLQSLLKTAGVRVGMYTAAQKDDVESLDLIIGTHALLQEGVILPRLALVVVDEQHRFGVRQRGLLRQNQKGQVPHLLSMTATPIPRTLALALYGDLDVSVLPEKPAGRLSIETRVVHPNERAAMYERVRAEIKAGHQVFVICPLIEEKPSKNEVADENSLFEIPTGEELEKKEKKTVLAEAERLRKEFPDFGVIEVVHGRLKAEEKRNVMDRMAAGEIQVLVATSVIEVGVDVPNATVMVIEGAERFGLAQLHQFRGRVGRGLAQSYCFLCPTVRGQRIEERLQAVADTNNGFEVAEADLQLRGPGELSGQIQSGLPDFRMASLTDLEFLKYVKGVVDAYAEKNPEFLQKYAETAYVNAWGSLE